MEIIPGILEQDFEEIRKKIEIVLPFVNSIHIDLLDGKFAANTTFLDPSAFKEYTKKAVFELHMMTDEPINYLQSFADAGFRRFLGHVEKMSNQEEFVAQGQLLGEVGLALDGPTGLDAITVPYDDLDVVHFYISDRIGFAGPPMMPERLERIKAFRKANVFLPVEVDGGVKDTTIKLAKEAGATRFVATSFISGAQSPQQAYKTLQEAVK